MDVRMVNGDNGGGDDAEVIYSIYVYLTWQFFSNPLMATGVRSKPYGNTSTAVQTTSDLVQKQDIMQLCVFCNGSIEVRCDQQEELTDSRHTVVDIGQTVIPLSTAGGKTSKTSTKHF